MCFSSSRLPPQLHRILYTLRPSISHTPFLLPLPLSLVSLSLSLDSPKRSFVFLRTILSLGACNPLLISRRRYAVSQNSETTTPALLQRHVSCPTILRSLHRSLLSCWLRHRPPRFGSIFGTRHFAFIGPCLGRQRIETPTRHFSTPREPCLTIAYH